MGDFTITIEAVGGHGCERETGDGGSVAGCGRIGCPDCETREFLKRLASTGNSLKAATLVHWPGTPGQVTDRYEVKSQYTAPQERWIPPTYRRTREGSFR